MKTIQDHIDDDKKELDNNGMNPQRRRHLQNEISELELKLQMQGESSMANPIQHDLDHEVYIDPKDHKEHINHGMVEYSEDDLKMSGFMQNHEGDEDDGWKSRHQDKHLEVYCDNHPDAMECRVYDD